MADDRLALEELLRNSAGASHVVHHYLYLPDAQVGDQVATELRREGFTIEQRAGADGDSWLVLATHTLVPSEKALARVRQTMETLADRFDGEYDGWEAELP